MSLSSVMTASQMLSPKSGVGFRFSPTDEELVDHFLMGKIHAHENDDYENAVIPEIKLCDYEPWELPDLVKKDSNDQAWHFFSACNYKYKGSLRFNRVTKAGFWKPTGKPRRVINRRTNKVIGTKKSLVFYKKQKHPYKPQRTSFIMHEYDAIAKGKLKYLLYKLKVEWDEKTDNDELDQMACSAVDHTNQMTVNSSCEVGEIMSGNTDFGNQSDENKVYSYGKSEKEKGSHLGSDFENQIPENMIQNMSTCRRELNRSENYGFEDQNQDEQDDMLVSKSISAAAEKNDSGPKSLEGLSTIFDQLEVLFGPEDHFYSALLGRNYIKDHV